MGYAPDSSEFERMSTKKLAILFGLAFFGVLMIIQMIQGFPLAQLFTRQTITEEVSVSIKQDGVCVVEASDGQPKEIRDCQYSVDDVIVVTYYERAPTLESHRPR